MKKLMGAALLAGATVAGAGAANAEVSGSVTFTSDYVFRGLSQTNGNAAVQGSLDWSQDMFYAGVWGSNVDFGGDESVELDLYAGITPTTGPVSWDIGLVGYFYPGADSSGELDYYEGIVSGSMDLTEQFSIGGVFAYTPDYAGGSYDDGTYYEINGGFAISDATAITAAYGVQDIDGYGGSYSTWNVGLSHTMHGFNLGLVYSDTEDAFENGYGSESNTDGRFSFSVGRSL